jgi:DNA-binding CsgD family transcriptional regulator/PAS domain-containing protein
MEAKILTPELLELIYGAALGQNSWHDILKRLEREFPGVRFGLWGHDLRANRNIGLVYQGFDPAAMEPWINYYSKINPWAPGLASAPVGAIHFAEQLLSREELLATEYYNDWIRPQEDVLTGVGLTVYSDAERFFALTTNIRARDETKLKEALARALVELGPHLSRAFALTRAVRESISSHQLEAALEVMTAAALLLDGRGRVIFFNSAARSLLARQSGLSIDAGGFLTFSDPTAQLAVSRLLSAMGSADYGSIPSSFDARENEEDEQLRVRLVPFRDAAEADPAALFSAPRRPAVLAFIEPAEEVVEKRAQRQLLNHFRLSQTESDLALALCRGEKLTDVASRRRVSIHTVRNQLKSVFTKTGVSSQGQLVALVWKLATQRRPA